MLLIMLWFFFLIIFFPASKYPLFSSVSLVLSSPTGHVPEAIKAIKSRWYKYAGLIIFLVVWLHDKNSISITFFEHIAFQNKYLIISKS